MKNLLLIGVMLFLTVQMHSQCNNASDYTALRELYLSTDGDNWTDNTGWPDMMTFNNNATPPTPTDMADWYGITCDNGRVDRVALVENNLVGNIPEEISLLENVTDLRLHRNQLSGAIPTSIGDMTSLTTIFLNKNQLTGNIPTQLGNLTNLTLLNLSHNSLSGSIPSELGNLSNLSRLLLQYNETLSGSIPSELGDLALLQSLQLGHNSLSGNIPSSLGQLTNLTRLDLQFNNLEGAIPASLKFLVNLESLRLQNNDLSQCIPTEVLNLFCSIDIANVDLSNNPLLPFEGIITDMCSTTPQIGAPCNDGDPSTTGEVIQSDCSCSINAPTEVCDNATEYQVLVNLYNDTNGDLWKRTDNWNVSAPAGNVPNMAGWYGVTCMSGEIVSIDLNNNNLDGSLPTNIYEITQLRNLDLSSNNLQGEIPEEFMDSETLETLILDNNMLVGEIPSGLDNLIGLYKLYLNDNNLSGCIDPAIVSLICNLGPEGRLSNNPLLPYQGDEAQLCVENSAQIGASCDDGDDTTTGEVIQEDCVCRYNPCFPDLIAPTIQCDDKTISIVTDNQVLFADAFLDEYNDNCTTDLTLQVRRLNPNNGSEDNWAPSVTITCEDVDNTGGQPITFELRAIDNFDNVSVVCESVTTFSDKLKPVIMTELPDFTVGCDYLINIDDLSEFGKMVGDADLVEEIVIEDASNVQTGEDGMYIESCVVSIDEEVNADLDDCGIGTITRTFTISDQQGNAATTSQTITIEKRTFFDPSEHIQWPETYVHIGCQGTAPEPSVSGEPIIENQPCAQLSLPTYTDFEFEHENGGCNKILRRWSIIDWCTFDVNTGAGKYEYDQVIKLMDNTEPIFDTAVCEDAVFDSYSNDCTALVSLSATATDNCTELTDENYTYKLYDDSETLIAEGEGANFEEQLPIGTYTFKWSVNDYCGNITTCNKLLTVRDVKPPAIICEDGLNINMNQMVDAAGNTMVMATIPVEYFVKETSDFCTEDSEIALSYSSDVTDTEWNVNCTHKGIQTVTIYATDTNGNQDFCTTQIDVQDNYNYCPEPSNINISGRITTENNVAISGFTTALKGTESYRTVNTDEEGNYVFEDIPNTDIYELEVESAEADARDVTVIDLVKVQRHLLGMKLIDSPYKIIAADVDGSKSITPYDLLHLRDYILRITDEFPMEKSWVAIDKNSMDMSSPYNYSESLNIAPSYEDIIDADFTALRVGDINGSYENALLKDADIRSNIETIHYESEEDKITYRTTQDLNLTAMQITLPLNEETRVTKVISDMLSENNLYYSINGNELTIIWSDIQPIKTLEGTPLLTIIGENLTSIDQNEISEAYIYTEYDEEKIISLREGSDEDMQFDLSQNYPNPFLAESYVDLLLPESGKVIMTLIDYNGRVISDSSQYMEAGLHSLDVGTETNQPGVYTLRVSVGQYTSSIKLVKMK